MAECPNCDSKNDQLAAALFDLAELRNIVKGLGGAVVAAAEPWTPERRAAWDAEVASAEAHLSAATAG